MKETKELMESLKEVRNNVAISYGISFLFDDTNNSGESLKTMGQICDEQNKQGLS